MKTTESSNPKYRNYVIGFVLSILLTVTSYLVVRSQIDPNQSAQLKSLVLPAIMSLAIVQLAVQVIFFLHLNRESKPRWNVTAFSFMLIVVFILVAATLWIMKNLNYGHNHSSPNETDTYIIHDEGIR